MRVRDFVIGTTFGVLPGTFVYVLAGRQLMTIEQVSDIVSLRVLGSFALLGVLALIPTFYRIYKKRQTNSSSLMK